MNAALAIDPDAYPPARMINVLSQRKAQWYLDSIDEFFLPDIDDWTPEEGEEF
jgi:hypothetical protein